MASSSKSGKGKAGSADTDKHKVTMRSMGLAPNGEMQPFEATDYVPEDMLEVYVADARTRWQYVEVSEGYDAGPGGADGPTQVPAHLANRSATDFSRYGDASTPDNALDEHVAANPHLYVSPED